MRMLTLILTLLLALGAEQTVQAQVKAGTAGAQFLKLSASARGLAMADALLPLADDVSALYYNPGGLTQLEGWHAAFTHYALPVGVNQEWLGVARGMPESGWAWGAALTFLSSGMMDETTPLKPEGTGRQFDYQDLAIGVSVAKRLTNKFSTGLTLKFINESTMEMDATGWGADVGTFYDTGWRSLKMAMIISNFGPDMKFIEKEYPLPILFKFGVSMDLWGLSGDEHHLTGAFEFGHPSDNVEQINVGLEYSFRERFMLRMGKKINGIARDDWEDYFQDTSKDPFVEYPLLSMDGFTIGAGFRFQTGVGDLAFDYAYEPNEFLESRNMITLSWWR
jgi:hypothetical protein